MGLMVGHGLGSARHLAVVSQRRQLTNRRHVALCRPDRLVGGKLGQAGIAAQAPQALTLAVPLEVEIMTSVAVHTAGG
jgi:hypothetical protein